LENVLFRAVLLSQGPLLTIRDFPQLTGNQVTDFRSNVPIDTAEKNSRYSIQLIDDNGQIRAYNELEREIIERTVHHYRGRMSEAARRLGIGRSTLYRKLDEYHAENQKESEALRRAS